MRNIQPVHWKRNSPNVTALSIQLVYDNLSTLCTTVWQVKAEGGLIIDQGNVTISGDDYKNWDGSNDFVYQYVADQLNVTIISEVYDGALGPENLQ